MYFKKSFDSVEKVQSYYNSLLIEQDNNSPHRYISDSFSIDNKDIVLDAGAAEGIFALDVVDKVKKIYLIESDDTWNMALEKTFEPYKEKVNIVNKFLSDVDDKNSITLENLYKREIFTVIKMDIEGFEYNALKGGSRCLKKYYPQLMVCAYHHVSDEAIISEALINLGYKIKTTKGYMVFIHENINPHLLVRGIIYAKKEI